MGGSGHDHNTETITQALHGTRQTEWELLSVGLK